MSFSNISQNNDQSSNFTAPVSTILELSSQDDAGKNEVLEEEILIDASERSLRNLEALLKRISTQNIKFQVLNLIPNLTPASKIYEILYVILHEDDLFNYFVIKNPENPIQFLMKLISELSEILIIILEEKKLHENESPDQDQLNTLHETKMQKISNLFTEFKQISNFLISTGSTFFKEPSEYDDFFEEIKSALELCLPETLFAEPHSKLDSIFESNDLLDPALMLATTFAVNKNFLNMILACCIAPTTKKKEQSCASCAAYIKKKLVYKDFEDSIIKLISCQSKLDATQIKDLIKFYFLLRDEMFQKLSDFENAAVYYQTMARQSLDKIESLSLITSETEFNADHFHELQEVYIEFLQSSQELKELSVNMDDFLESIELIRLCPYFFNQMNYSDLIKIFEISKNSTTLFKNLKIFLKSFINEAKSNATKKEFESQVTKIYSSQNLVKINNLFYTFNSNCYTSLQNYLILLNQLSLDNTIYDLIKGMNERIKQSKKSTLRQIQSGSIHPEAQPELPLPDSDATSFSNLEHSNSPSPGSFPSAPLDRPLTAIEEVVIDSAPSRKSPLEIISISNQSLKALYKENGLRPSNPIAIRFLDNAEVYFYYLLNLCEQFARNATNKLTPMQISAFARNLVICGSTMLEQILMALNSQQKNCKNLEDTNHFRSHNLVRLSAIFTFSPRLKPEVLTIIRSNELGEIWSRRILKDIVGQFNPALKTSQVKNILEMVYLFATFLPTPTPRPLLKACKFYISDIIKTFIGLHNYFSESHSASNFARYQSTVDDFMKAFREIKISMDLEETKLENKIPEFDSLLEQLNNAESLHISDVDLENLKFLVALQNEDIRSLHEATLEEVAYIYSRVLQQNQLIFKQLLELLVRSKAGTEIRLEGVRGGREFDDLYQKLLEKIEANAFSGLGLNSEEIEFIKRRDEARFAARYLVEEEGLSNSAKKAVKKGRRKKQPEALVINDGFKTVSRSKEADLSKMNAMKKEIENNCRIMNSILRKLMNNKDFKKEFGLL